MTRGAAGATARAAGPATTEDRLLNGRVRLRQPASGYRVAIDPVLLAAAVPASRPSPDGPARALDLGCGVGAAGLCVLARLPDVTVTGLELQGDLAALARDNAALNGWADRFTVVEGDIAGGAYRAGGAGRGALAAEAGARDGFDEVLCNPPHQPAAMVAAPDPAKAVATREAERTLDDWVDAALARLKPRGWATFLHRADRLDALLAALAGRAGGAIVFPLWPKPGRAARRVLVRARKGARAPLTLSAGLVLHAEDGGFTEAAQRVLRDGAGLDL